MDGKYSLDKGAGTDLEVRIEGGKRAESGDTARLKQSLEKVPSTLSFWNITISGFAIRQEKQQGVEQSSRSKSQNCNANDKCFSLFPKRTLLNEKTVV